MLALLRDRSGNVAVGYVIFTAFAIALALAVVQLSKPIATASDLAVHCLADNNP